MPESMVVSAAERVIVHTAGTPVPAMPESMVVGPAEQVAVHTAGPPLPKLPESMVVGPAEQATVHTAAAPGIAMAGLTGLIGLFSGRKPPAPSAVTPPADSSGRGDPPAAG
jgi:hypothetical protein